MYRKSSTSDRRKLVVGDVVLVRDDVPVPRGKWRMGRVVIGKDGQTRGAELRMLSKEGKRTTCYRPNQNLIPFEISEENTYHQPESDQSSDIMTESEKYGKEHANKRNMRQAAKTGEIERRLRDMYY